MDRVNRRIVVIVHGGRQALGRRLCRNPLRSPGRQKRRKFPGVRFAENRSQSRTQEFLHARRQFGRRRLRERHQKDATDRHPFFHHEPQHDPRERPRLSRARTRFNHEFSVKRRRYGIKSCQSVCRHTLP